MGNNLTEIVCVIDNSGSMGIVKSDAIGGFNAFIEAQRKVEGDAVVSVYLFNDKLTQIADNMDIQEVTLLSNDNYFTNGFTAMNDALGYTIDKVAQRIIDTKNEERPNKVIFCILTDGQENNSKEFTTTQIKDMVKHRQENFDWEFVFLAANQDAFATGAKYAFDVSGTFSFESNSKGVAAAYDGMNNYVTTARS